MRLFSESIFHAKIREVGDTCPLIIYGAGMDAIWAIEEYKRIFGHDLYGCVCDGDSAKQVQRLDDLEILSPDDALAKYTDAYVWVAAKEYRFEIIGYLVYEKKVDSTRILNYEAVEKRRSCLYAEKKFLAREWEIGGVPTCLISVCDRVKDIPILYLGKYDVFHQSEFCDFRDTVIENIETESSAAPCFNCGNARESYFAVARKIRNYNLATDGVCNFRCIYCDASIHKKLENIFDFVGCFEELERGNVLAEDLHIDITSGEICVNPYREEMLNTAVKYAETVSIATNASVYNEQICGVLESKRASLIVSMDAGTRETFAKIKGRDMFERVYSNVVAYRKAGKGAVELKYIFIPGVNDNISDVEGFVDMCKKVDPGVVTISFDFNYKGSVGKETAEMIHNMAKLLQDAKLFYKYEARAVAILQRLKGAGR